MCWQLEYFRGGIIHPPFRYTTFEIENWNGECVKETTTRLKSRQHPKTTNGSSMQRETPAPGGFLQLAPTQIFILRQW